MERPKLNVFSKTWKRSFHNQTLWNFLEYYFYLSMPVQREIPIFSTVSSIKIDAASSGRCCRCTRNQIWFYSDHFPNFCCTIFGKNRWYCRIQVISMSKKSRKISIFFLCPINLLEKSWKTVFSNPLHFHLPKIFFCRKLHFFILWGNHFSKMRLAAGIFSL